MSQTITILSKIVAIREGQYTEIVVEDLNRDYTDDFKYVTVDFKLREWRDMLPAEWRKRAIQHGA
jgi:hypothetical protein